MNPSPQPVNFVKRYCGTYVLIYVGLIVLAGIVLGLLGFQSPGTGIVVAMCAAFQPGCMFYKDQGRLPIKAEIRKFGLYATGMVTLLFIVYLAAIFPFAFSADEKQRYLDMLSGKFLIILPLVMLATLALQYFVTAWGFQRGVKIQIKAEERKKQKELDSNG